MDLFVKPTPLADAVQKLGSKGVVPSLLRTAEWADVPVELRDKAFFSAGVDWARFLDDSKAKLADAIALRKEQVANGTAYVDRSSFIGDMRKLVLSQRSSSPPGGEGGGEGSLTDLASRARLGLIFDMQTQSAAGYARFKYEQDPDVLNAFPAQELVREESRLRPRDWTARWAEAGGELYGARMIALKTDPVWTAISRFGVPWPPFDFGSGMGVRDISREEAEQIGLLQASDVLTPSEALDFLAETEVDVGSISPETLLMMQSAFGDKLEISGGKARWAA